MKTEKQRATMLKRALRFIQGIEINWDDDADLALPKSQLRNLRVTHSNPMVRPVAVGMWCEYKNFFMAKAVVCWLVDITVVFDFAEVEQHEQRRLVHKGRLTEIGEACDTIIKQMMRYGKNPREVRFRCVCLGNRPPRDADFGDYQ